MDRRLSHPLDLLHVDDWLEVLERIDDPRSLINLCSSHIFFRNLLASFRIGRKKVTIEVLRLEEVLPLVLKWLPQSRSNDLLTVRLVCKRISSRVDKLIEDDAHMVPYDNLNLCPSLVPPTTPLDWPAVNSYEWRHIKMPRRYPRCNFRRLVDLYLLEDDIEEGLQMIGKRISINVATILREEYDVLYKAQWHGKFMRLGPNVRLALDWMGIGTEELRIDPTGKIIGFNEKVLESNFLEKTFHFFSRYPDHFRQVHIGTHCKINYKRFYNLFCGLIASLPRLRVLKWSTGNGLSRDIADREEDNQEPHQFLPIPDCPFLEILTIDSPHYIFLEHFVRQIGQKYGSHLGSLKIAMADDDTAASVNGEPRNQYGLEGWGEVEPYDCDALKTLEVKLVRSHMDCLTRMNAPNLKILKLYLNAMDNIYLDLAVLINVILGFPSMVLMELKTDFEFNEIPAVAMVELEKIEEEDRHKNLRRLDLKVRRATKFTVPLRFWTGLCPKLEMIQVTCFPLFASPCDMLPQEHPDYKLLDEDMSLLMARKFEKSRMWEESQNLKQVKWRHYYYKYFEENPTESPVYTCDRRHPQQQ